MEPPFSDAFRLIDEEGNFDEAAGSGLDLKKEDFLELYRLMTLARRVDTEATALQRQGELAVYPPLIGQEAAQIGSAFALGESDFVFPSYRELGVALARGIDLVEYLHFYRGTWHGGTYDPLKSRFGMVAVPIASQIPHAVGYALGAKLDSKPIVVMVYFGDGATSQGDFHEGCNFASVFDVPVVLFCQNNGWAISVPVEEQTRAPIYRKADAYGIEGVCIDGNDVLATYLVTKQAVERARTQSRPTLIEAITYRIGPHSTADDAGRYQPADQIEHWKGRDPLDRYRKFLSKKGYFDESVEAKFGNQAEDLAAHIRAGIVGAPPAPESELFEWVFAARSEGLAKQERELMEEAESDG